jgi:hypothetical protein
MLHSFHEISMNELTALAGFPLSNVNAIEIL